MKKRIAIIGTNGLPSNYGGFETLVEYLVEYLSDSYEITVFCSGVNLQQKEKYYKGAKLEYINLSANNYQSILFDIISVFKSYKKFDKILILGSSGCIILPFFYFYKNKFIFNFGGLDWQRSKWNFFAQKFLKYSEAFGIYFSKHLIADNLGIQEYIRSKYKKESYLITYGGDQAVKVNVEKEDIIKYPFITGKYAFSVARIQEDNNIEMLLNAFNVSSIFPYVLVGNWNKSEYGIRIKERYSGEKNLILLDAIYDKRELNVLRSNCTLYLHGHSAGGTNPALVEAMNLGLPILAFDNSFNKYTTKFKTKYFATSIGLRELIDTLTETEIEEIAVNMLKIAKSDYQWSFIANQYSKVFDI